MMKFLLLHCCLASKVFTWVLSECCFSGNLTFCRKKFLEMLPVSLIPSTVMVHQEIRRIWNVSSLFSRPSPSDFLIIFRLMYKYTFSVHSDFVKCVCVWEREIHLMENISRIWWNSQIKQSQTFNNCKETANRETVLLRLLYYNKNHNHNYFGHCGKCLFLHLWNFNLVNFGLTFWEWSDILNIFSLFHYR